jgi:1,4-alpha-glucan branching enzyme
MNKGIFNLVLHAHLPFVRHVEYEEYLEERWLFEAIIETYIPLLEVFENLKRDNIKFYLTMS